MNKLPTYKVGMRKILVHKRKYLTLLEVLVAFSIVVMSIFPLLYPHVFIFRQQSVYTQKIEMNHAVNLLFGEIYQRLYQQEIPLNEILEKREFAIDETLLKMSGYEGRQGFTGDYHFRLIRDKTNDSKSKAVYLVELMFNLKLKGQEPQKTYHFNYTIFIYQESTQSTDEERADEN